MQKQIFELQTLIMLFMCYVAELVAEQQDLSLVAVVLGSIFFFFFFFFLFKISGSISEQPKDKRKIRWHHF